MDLIIKDFFNEHSFIEKIKEQISIVDIIQHYVHLKKKGNNWLGLCPFHNDQHPSFSVNNSRQVFNCFACGQRGDVFDFVQKYKKYTPQRSFIGNLSK